MSLKLIRNTIFLSLISTTALAGEDLQGRAELKWRYGDERSILMNEFWFPLWQEEDRVIYGGLRLSGDDRDNREGNIGVGYRELLDGYDSIIGVNLWLDRRITDRGSCFHQLVAGGEWLGESIDFRGNVYRPLNDEKEYITANTGNASPYMAGNGIYVDTAGKLIEEAQHGFDLELGWNVPFLRENVDDFRLYGGVYYFNGNYTPRMTGWRARISSDISSDFQFGIRFQKDGERGSQGFLEATLRFPLGAKKSRREEGLRARLDESPERDIDIVTGAAVTDNGRSKPVINKATGKYQQVIHVDNTADAEGDGSAENPYNTLADAEDSAEEHSIIYVHEGDGTSANQDQGIILYRKGQQLIGSGTDFIWDGIRFGISNSVQSSPDSIVIAPASTAPVITNANADSDGITISADDIVVAGVTVAGAARDGISVNGNNSSIDSVTSRNNTRHGVYALNTNGLSVSGLMASDNIEDGVRLEASGAGNALRDVFLSGVTATGNKNGVRLYARDDASITGASMALSSASANNQHGVIVYDDSTAGSIDADLGGGGKESAGLNILAGNGLEDIAVELDGGTLYARNNWWGQATGPDTDNPSVGIAPQIYYGAPVNDGLAGHWTFDSEWSSETLAYDRSGNNNDGILHGGLSLSDMTEGIKRKALDFDGDNDFVDIGSINSANSLMLNNSDATIVVWFNKKPGGDRWQRIVDKSTNSSATNGYSIALDNTNGYAIMADNTYRAKGTITYDVWHHFAGIYNNNGDAEIHLDTIILSSTLNIPNIPDVEANMRIGSWNHSTKREFGGLLDDVRIYARALSETDISELYRMDTSSSVETAGFLTSAP
jgi:hypothetical protein